jgi:Choline/Carnitine o-acyltransferase
MFVAHARGSGLRKVLKEGDSVPEIFEDPVVKRASHWVLSTSPLFSKHLREYGWGEVRLSFFFRVGGVDGLLFRSCQMALVFHISPALMVRVDASSCACVSEMT